MPMPPQIPKQEPVPALPKTEAQTEPKIPPKPVRPAEADYRQQKTVKNKDRGADCPSAFRSDT